MSLSEEQQSGSRPVAVSDAWLFMLYRLLSEVISLPDGVRLVTMTLRTLTMVARWVAGSKFTGACLRLEGRLRLFVPLQIFIGSS